MSAQADPEGGSGMDDTTVEDVAQDPEPDEEPVAEPLIEEISIDGMCGVY
jgi:mycofactocin precursor